MEIYPKEIQVLLTTKGFVEAYFKQYRNTSIGKEAYELVEQVHEDYFGMRKYSGWESFRKVKNRFIKTMR